ncbi:lipopolysaccharide/colanic/teichoic acid biosynthesis glycosyltransferase [Bacillus mesophilus]|uniref:Sugar transferase n=1 Tax=Bacillus mesophilus TaxID=1808955 RepID=A0A6M0Q7Q7_9BACI|nr:sugar transferase [Bacillus mesophilus]MBM7661649.1 lipopolysaccharide/colanic/teichoic acid biosynthesis glycosyltransferase [Bacillus mesophilus]NEY72317.1 sugar transferase [Bacillus mesophilus]
MERMPKTLGGEPIAFQAKPFEIGKVDGMIKRGFDIIISVLLIIVTSPITLILLMMIPLTSKGSSIYTQERLGINGMPFLIYKFRSMIDGAEVNTGPVLALSKDPRITKIGAFLRATRLDELPQLYNVLIGDMSLVGPRPERHKFVTEFCLQLPDYPCRMNVKPGITGYAQIKGTYRTPPAEKLHYDKWYIENYSIWLDIKILCKTALVVVNLDKARGV